MALSYVKYTANGSTNQFAVTFSYISASDVHVYINGVEDQSYTFVNSALVQTSSTPANGAIVEVRRQTSNTARLVDFQDGSVLTEADLDASANQNFFTVQENFDRTQDTIQLTATDVFDGQSKRITNVANPTSDQDVATKHYLENTWLTTANKTALTTINSNISNINSVNSNASNINSVVSNASNINTVAGSISNVNTVGGIASNVTTVAGITSNIASAVSNASNITTVANNIGSVNTVATDIAKVIAVANDLAEAVSEVETVADDLNEATSEIDTVATNIANVNTVGGISSNVTTVAGISSNVTTVAGISSAVSGVSNIASVVSAVNSNASNINSVNSNASNINTVAGAVSNVNNVGGDIANVNTVAGIASNVTAVAGKASEIALLGTSDAVNDLSTLGTSDVVNDMNVLGTSANVTAMNTLGTNTNVSNMSTLAGISGNITTVAGISSNVSTVAGISSAVSTVSGMNTAITTANSNSSNINTVAGAISNVNTVGGAIANVNTVASNLASVNAFGEQYRIGSSDPTSSLNEGDLFYNSTSNSLKVYDGNSWVAGVTLGSGFLPLTGGTMTGNLDVGGTVTADGLTVGDGGAEDTKIVFDGNAQDFYVALDDSADDLVIGLGNTVGTTPIMSFDESKNVTIHDGTLKVESDNANALVAPLLQLDRISSSPADGDLIGAIRYTGRLDNGSSAEFAGLEAKIIESSTADGEITLNIAKGGNVRSAVKANNTEVIINDASEDIDFRVESNGNSKMFFVDGGNDAVIFNGNTSDYEASSQVVQLHNTGLHITSGYGIQGGVNADRASINLTSGSSGHVRFNVNNSEKARFTSTGLGIGETSPQGNLHVKSADSGASAHASADEVVIEGSANSGINILSGNSSEGAIYFGDDGDNNIGSITYTHNNNNLHFDVNASRRMTIDSSGRLGIGTTSPASELHVVGHILLNNAYELRQKDTSGNIRTITRVNNSNELEYGWSGGAVKFMGGGSYTERMRIDASSGQIGIGNSLPNSFNSQARNLVVGSGSGAQGLTIYSGNDSSGNIFFADGTSGDDPTRGGITYKHDDNSMLFRVNDSNRMAISSAGTVLIGKTAEDTATDGIELNRNDVIVATRNGDAPLLLNRRSSNGDIAVFRKDNTNIGSIGIVNGDNPYFQGNATNHGGLQCGTNTILPCKNGANSDNTLDLGQSDIRWKDIYLSGGAFIGGTGSANQLDDYEEGTWTPSGASLGVATIHKAVYTKIGNVVTVYCDITYNPSPSDTAQATSLSGLPFSASDDYYQQNTRVASRNQNISAQVGGASVSFRDVADGVIMTRSEFADKRAQHTFIYTTA